MSPPGADSGAPKEPPGSPGPPPVATVPGGMGMYWASEGNCSPLVNGMHRPGSCLLQTLLCFCSSRGVLSIFPPEKRTAGICKVYAG